MSFSLDALADREFDVLVLGGGMTGAAAARDLAGRGARVLLVEPIDFGWGASGRTVRLASAGADSRAPVFGPASAALRRERVLLARAARHLVRPTPVAVFAQRREGWARRLLTRGVGVLRARRPATGWPAPRTLTPQQAELALPGFKLSRAAPLRVYFDALVEDRRLCLVTALDARRAGAALAPRCDVTGLEAGPRRRALAEIRDRITGDTAVVTIRSVINATGPWVDQTRRAFDVGREAPRFDLRRGARLVGARCVEAGAVFDHPRDGGTVVLAPAFEGVLAAPRPRAGGAVVADEDPAAGAARLQEALEHAFGGPPTPIRAGFAATDVVAKAPRLVAETAFGVPFWSLAGGDLLGARLAALRAGDRLAAAIGPFRGSTPAPAGFLPGGDIASVAGEEAAARADGLSPLQARWIVGRYGSLWRDLLREPGGAAPLGAGEFPLASEVVWAVRSEAARTLSDLLMRWRTPEIVDDRASESALVHAAEAALAGECSWSALRRERERARWEREREQVYGRQTPDSAFG